MTFLISDAWAAGTTAATTAATATPPSAGETFMLNMILIAIMVGLFYFLLIMPQQRRFKKHRDMLGQLQKGDRIVTAGGLIGTVDKMVEGTDEMIVDLGNGVKVTVLRSTVHGRMEEKKG